MKSGKGSFLFSIFSYLFKRVKKFNIAPVEKYKFQNHNNSPTSWNLFLVVLILEIILCMADKAIRANVSALTASIPLLLWLQHLTQEKLHPSIFSQLFAISQLL